MVVHLSHLWIKEMLVELLLRSWPAESANICLCYMKVCTSFSQVTATVFEYWRTHANMRLTIIKSHSMCTHIDTHIFYWRCYTITGNPVIWPLLPCVSAQRRDTPSVYWVLFVWCCLTSAWEESTLPLLRWYTQCFRGVVMKRAQAGNKPRWCHQEFFRFRERGEKRRGPECCVGVFLQSWSLSLPQVWQMWQPRQNSV